ncbi:hypothetical protein [Polynucleobacter sp. MWH-UH23A]|uniref:hypothetical protein n=1 Tax=Polynucleobacter sp. MWH-UH23A TaxID=1855613 RepID=UPI0033650B7C
MSKNYILLPPKISHNMILRRSNIYIVEGEVQVLKAASLRAEDGAKIYLVNGMFRKSRLKRSALIFNQGSSFKFINLTISAADKSYKTIKLADNGGVWFLGTKNAASKDSIKIAKKMKIPFSSFTGKKLSLRYLGKEDGQSSINEDIDGISILGVDKHEWNISSVSSNYSGDDGLDLTNSHISLNSLDIKNPAEDAINLSSSRLEIHKSLKICSPKNGIKDRDLFDFESDDGASYLELYRGTSVNIEGVFGDQLNIYSQDMPIPITKGENERTYKFNKKLKNSALIFTIDKD